MSNGNMPANPQSGAFNCSDDFNSSEDMGGSGLTKREHFASLALQGLCGSGSLSNATDMARASVCVADALLKELENTNKE